MEKSIKIKIRHSRTKYILIYVLALIAILSPFYLANYDIKINLQYGLIIAIILVIVIEILVHKSHLLIRNEGIRKEEGIIKKVYIDINYQDIVRTTVKQSGIARLLKYGTLEIDASGREGTEMTMKNIYKPLKVKEIIDHLIDYYKRMQFYTKIK